jgi:hypothetical protein
MNRNPIDKTSWKQQEDIAAGKWKLDKLREPLHK